MTRVTEKILNIKQEINALAAPKNHTHPQYLENTSDTTYLTDVHSDKKATATQLGHVIVDTVVKDSINPVTNKAIKNYVDTIPKITLDSSVTRNSTNGVTSGAVYNAINDAKLSSEGLSATNPTEMALNSFDGANEPGSYKINANIPMANRTSVDTNNGILTVLKHGTNSLTHILNLPNGREYRRHGTINNNNIIWDDWKVSYIPFQKYTTPLSGATYNNNVHDIEIFQDTMGYTIRWNQTFNPDGNAQTYFLSHSTQYEYKHVVKFSKNLDIAGPYVFANLIGTFDIKIQADGIYLRSTKASAKINGIDETYFVPRTP